LKNFQDKILKKFGQFRVKHEKISNYVITYGSLIAIFSLSILIPFDYNAGFHYLVILEVCSVLLLAAGILYFWYSKNYLIVSSGILLILYFLISYALHVNHSYASLKWYFLLPMSSVFLLGFKRSLAANIVFFFSFSWFALQLEGQISNKEIFFVILAFLLVIITSLLHEYTRFLAVEDIKKISVTDPLTGVHNRRFFDRELTIAIQSSRRTQIPMSLVFFDVDHFKQINDRFGHKTGDSVLLALTSLYKENFRAHDRIFRTGGEEFALILKSDQKQSELMMKRFMKMISDDDFLKGYSCTVSVGIAELIDADDEESVMKRADDLMYRAKEKGRNQIALA